MTSILIKIKYLLATELSLTFLFIALYMNNATIIFLYTHTYTLALYCDTIMFLKHFILFSFRKCWLYTYISQVLLLKEYLHTSQSRLNHCSFFAGTVLLLSCSKNFLCVFNLCCLHLCQMFKGVVLNQSKFHLY